MDYLEGFTYENVNFIFSGATYHQDIANSTLNTNTYKFGYSEPGTFSYYDYCDAYAINDWTMENNEYTRQMNETIVNERTTSEHTQTQQDGRASSSYLANPAECVESNHNPIAGEYHQVVDPDNMTYEELVELGEIVGSESRGVSQEAISLLPISKFKCGFFLWRKKSRNERCVICQMEYRRGERQITLPCKHRYHGACGSRWLSINKACPICYKEVHVHISKNLKNRICKTR